MKFIRWGGLAGFVIVTALLFVMGYFFINGWVKKGIEVAGMNANGAEVNVSSVRLSLSPLGFTIKGVAVADADKPTHNAAELAQVQADVSLGQLFLGNVRIHNLVISDAKTGTERSRTAEVLDKAEGAGAEGPAASSGADADKTASSFGLELPSVESVTDQASENTQAAIDEAKATLADSRAELASASESLPDEAAIDRYKEQIAALEDLDLKSLEDIAQLRSQLAEINEQVKADRAAIENVQGTIKSVVSDNAAAIKNATGAPAEDWNALVDAYPLNQEGLLQVAELLLGEDVWSNVETGLYWYNKAKPWLARVQLNKDDEESEPARGEGQFVHFYHPDPTAKFQLDHGLVSLNADGWPWQLTVENIRSTTDGSVQPVHLQLRRGEESSAALLIDGTLERDGDNSIDTFTFNGRGVEVGGRDLEIAGADLNWVPEDADISGTVVSTNGELDGVITIQFPGNKFDVTGSGETVRYLQSAFQNISEFNIEVSVSGKLPSPGLSVRSNLDNKLSSALKDVAKEEYLAWLADVKTEFNEKANEQLAQLDLPVGEFDAQEALANGSIDSFESEVESRLDALKQKLVDKQAEIENKAKKEVEDKVGEEAGKLLDKIKF